MSLSLQTHRRDQSLYLGSLVSLGFPLFLWEWPLDDILSYIVFFCEVVQLADFSHTLGAKSSRNGVVSQTCNKKKVNSEQKKFWHSTMIMICRNKLL